ncbi:hypothetical protein Tco_0045872 [Tanacetum coccineum]
MVGIVDHLFVGLRSKTLSSPVQNLFTRQSRILFKSNKGIQATRDRQKSYADVRRKPLEFQVGDRVMLKVLAQVGDVTYRLELPQQISRVHSTFHVSNLKKCLSDELLAIPLDEIHIDDKLHFVEEPVEIIDYEVKWLKKSRIPIIKLYVSLIEEKNSESMKDLPNHCRDGDRVRNGDGNAIRNILCALTFCRRPLVSPMDGTPMENQLIFPNFDEVIEGISDSMMKCSLVKLLIS